MTNNASTIVVEGSIINQLISLDENDNRDKLRTYDRNTNVTALVIGKLLQENIENEYWKKLGYKDFKNFVGEEQFSFTARTAYNYVELWRLFVKWNVEYDRFIKIPYSKILTISAVLNEANVDEWIAKAETLSRTDLEYEVKEIKAVKDKMENRKVPKVYMCAKCGKWKIDAPRSEICEC